MSTSPILQGLQNYQQSKFVYFSTTVCNVYAYGIIVSEAVWTLHKIGETNIKFGI